MHTSEHDLSDLVHQCDLVGALLGVILVDAHGVHPQSDGILRRRAREPVEHLFELARDADVGSADDDLAPFARRVAPDIRQGSVYQLAVLLAVVAGRVARRSSLAVWELPDDEPTFNVGCKVLAALDDQ